MEHPDEVTFYCHHGGGFSPIVRSNRDHVEVQKKAQDVMVEFAKYPTTVETLEGKVLANRGDAIVTGSHEERWPVIRERFIKKYDPVAPTMFGQDGVYRSRPRRLAGLNMKKRFFVVLQDGVSKLTGSNGDWLIDYGDGSLGIVAARVFIDTYEVIRGNQVA